MDIIALSLGLVPVPPLPAQVVKRQADHWRRLMAESAREASGNRKHGPTVRAEIAAWLRHTGPATLLDVTTYYGMSLTNAKSHLNRMTRDGLARMEQEQRGGRLINVYYPVDPTA